MPKQSDDLSREGEQSQETEKAKLTIPVPKRSEFGRLLGKAAKRDASQSDQGKRRTSPDQ